MNLHNDRATKVAALTPTVEESKNIYCDGGVGKKFLTIVCQELQELFIP